MSKIKFNNGESWQRADNPTVPKMGTDYWNEADKQDAYNYAESILAALKETVVITIESTIDTTGALVTLEDITAGTTTEYTYQGSPLTLYVDAGVEYRITCDASSLGLNVEQSSTYTAMAANNRSISFDFRMATVEVNVTGVDSGFEVVVAVDGTEFARQTAASATYSIRKGASVTITPSSVDGYTSPSAVSLVTEAGESYSYTLAYEEVKLGVYIEDVNGKLWTADSWDGSVTANGVAVLTEDCRFVMALANAHSSTCRWGGYGTEVSGIATTTSESTAATDYAGEANTTTIINALDGTNDGYVDGAPAAEYCRAYTFPNGATGYMGAAGEWQAALDNKTAITSALSKCGGTAMSNYYWTSTHYRSDSSWCMHWNYEDLDYGSKYNKYYVRAFAAI